MCSSCGIAFSGKALSRRTTPKQCSHLTTGWRKNADPSWAPFFVEALTDYIVFQAEPSGYISEGNAAWLIAHITRSSDRVDSACEFELLVKTLERAKLSPVKLVTFALEQVKWGVIGADCYIGSARSCEPGVVDRAETEMVRRILFAFGGDGNIAVTRQEAGVLFDINDATSEAKNDPAWSDLFVKALANFLLVNFGLSGADAAGSATPRSLA